MFIKGIAAHLKKKFFPSPHQLVVEKWYADGGDYALRFNYDLNEGSVVFDIGGYEGQWASDLFSRYQCPIHIFEPVQSYAGRITERFANNSKTHVYHYGLGKTSRSEEIHIAADGSSIFGKSGNKENIKISDVKGWIGENLKENQDIDLMKINIEGGEYELLERLIETDLIFRIKNIQVQFHQISQDSLSQMERIQDHLKNSHEPSYQYKFVWENWVRKQ